MYKNECFYEHGFQSGGLFLSSRLSARLIDNVEQRARQNQAGNNQCNLNQDEIGKPCVDELSKLVNKDKNATPLLGDNANSGPNVSLGKELMS